MTTSSKRSTVESVDSDDGSSLSSHGSGDRTESPGFKRVVGFAEIQQRSPYPSSSENSYDDSDFHGMPSKPVMRRQSSLGQALLAHDMEKERPQLHLPLIRTASASTAPSSSRGDAQSGVQGNRLPALRTGVGKYRGRRMVEQQSSSSSSSSSSSTEAPSNCPMYTLPTVQTTTMKDRENLKEGNNAAARGAYGSSAARVRLVKAAREAHTRRVGHRRTSSSDHFEPGTTRLSKHTGSAFGAKRIEGGQDGPTSNAVPIPLHLSKAYSTPDPLPELSSSMIEQIVSEQAVQTEDANHTLCLNQQDSQGRQTIQLNEALLSDQRQQRTSPVVESRKKCGSNSASPDKLVAAMATASRALAEVAKLKEALSREKRLVSHLQNEITNLKNHMQTENTKFNNSMDKISEEENGNDSESRISKVKFFPDPVTPEAAAECASTRWRKDFSA